MAVRMTLLRSMTLKQAQDEGAIEDLKEDVREDGNEFNCSMEFDDSENRQE